MIYKVKRDLIWIEMQTNLNMRICLFARMQDTHHNRKTNKQTPWPLVRERTIPTERPPLVDETHHNTRRENGKVRNIFDS
jgi:hypothetical protein